MIIARTRTHLFGLLEPIGPAEESLVHLLYTRVFWHRRFIIPWTGIGLVHSQRVVSGAHAKRRHAFTCHFLFRTIPSRVWGERRALRLCALRFRYLVCNCLLYFFRVVFAWPRLYIMTVDKLSAGWLANGVALCSFVGILNTIDWARTNRFSLTQLINSCMT